MKKIALFTFSIVFAFQISIAQQTNFSKKVFLKKNDVNLSNATATSDGGALLFGNLSPKNTTNTATNILLKTDKNGKKQWVKSFSNGQSLENTDYALELSGGFLAVTVSDKNTLYVILLDSKQQIVWNLELKNNANTKVKTIKIIELPNKNIAFLGRNIEDVESFFVFVTDINGTIIFDKQYTHTNSNSFLTAKDINLTKQNDLMVSYSTADNFIVSPVTILPNIVKINPNNGNIFWNYTYSFNFPNNQSFEKIYERNDGTFVAHGSTYGTDPNGINGVEAILNFNQQGQNYSGTFFAKNEPRSMQMTQLSDNEYIVVLEKGSLNEKNILTVSNKGDIKQQFKEPKNKNNKTTSSITVLADKSILFNELSSDCVNENITNIFKRKLNSKGSCTAPSNIKSDKLFNFAGTSSNIIVAKTPLYSLKKTNNILKINDLNIFIGEESSICPDTTNVERCEGGFYQVGQKKYTTTGFYTDKILDDNGCDSIVYSNLKINLKDNKVDTILEKICNNKPLKIANTTISQSGVYAFALKNKLGCDSSFFVKVINESIKLNAEKSLTIKAGESQIIFANPNLSNLKYEWLPTDFLSCSDCENPISTPLKDIVYIVKAYNSIGCEDFASINILVKDCEKAFIPNAMSPNEDNINDAHTFFTSPCTERILRYTIYDRWGNILYEKNNFLPETNNIGWDGKYESQKVEKGVYIFYLSLQLKSGENKVFSGDLTIF